MYKEKKSAIVIVSWLLCRGKNLKFVFLPAVFMLLTTIGALLFQVYDSIRNKNFLIMIIAAALVVLTVLMIFDVITAMKRNGLKCRIL